MKRLLQFRLRSLFLLMMVCAVALGIGKWWHDSFSPVRYAWKPYSRSEMIKLRNSSRPVLVFFTAAGDSNADKVLDRALGDHEVALQIRRWGYELRIVDYTSRSPEVMQTLNDYKEYGNYPVISIHPAYKSEKPVTLSGDINKNELLSAIKHARWMTANYPQK